MINIPFYSNIHCSNGYQYGFGAMYLLEPNMPCFVHTSRTFDLQSESDSRECARHWVAAMYQVRHLYELLDGVAGLMGKIQEAVRHTERPCIELAEEPYYIKSRFFSLISNAEQNMARLLFLFERLASHIDTDTNSTFLARDVVCFPLARLMRIPQFDDNADNTNAGAEEVCLVFPDLLRDGFGQIKPEDEKKGTFLQSLHAAMKALHRAGIVHLDINPGNIMWRFNADSDSYDIKFIDFDVVCMLFL